MRVARNLLPLAVASAALVLGACGDGGSDLFEAEGDVLTVEEAAAGPIALGTLIEVEDDHELVVLEPGDQDAFVDEGGGVYRAAEAGTFEVVPYEHVPCGGPPDAFPSFVIEVDGDAAPDATPERPDGWRAPAAPAPQC